MNKLLIVFAITICSFGSGFTLGWFKGQSAMQASIDQQKVLDQTKAIEESLQLAKDEQKARLEAQQAEDLLNAIPDTGSVCINPEWVR